ncbi:shikimate kinase [Herbiconiux daphne]|uniref:Shikimate kinase n=1 Tax=Herbiconiux daphne TaxID=2970914 RepID=A0ABT2GZ66_9MICO|nr:shikimate kinase [Herbiconiux daphne]MCS5733251.1 shikimate kinase [Herbiconiux daphne]
MRLVLIGPPAAGKSRIGKRVARLLGLPFIDTDSLVVAAHGPISDIFATHGEPHFRSLERAEVVKALSADAVVSFGGGAVLDAETQHDLARHPVVLLTVQPHAVLSRLGNGKRPLVADVESWIALYEKRRDLYERLADHTVDTSDRPTDQLAAEIADWARQNATQPTKESTR